MTSFGNIRRMEEPLIRHVSDTAFMVAAFRAAESERPDSLFRDPLASSLAGERGKEIVAKLPKWFLGAWTIALRTVIIDDFIATALQDGVDTVRAQDLATHNGIEIVSSPTLPSMRFWTSNSWK